MKGIRDLADHLGLTVGTVSRALNGRPEVTEKTRRRVEAAAIEIGYVPNQSGRALRKGSTNTVGLMLEAGTPSAMGGDNFFAGVVAGLQRVLLTRGFDLVMLPCAPEEDTHAFLRRVVSRRMVDGLIISATQRHDRRIAFLADAKVPFVALGRSAEGSSHDWIDLDFEGVAGDAVDRLAAFGHRRIALASPESEINLGYVFRAAYEKALARHGIALDPEMIMRVETSETGGAVLAERLLALRERPSALLLTNETLAIGLYHRLAQADVLPGRDLAVIGFRENPQLRFLTPRLTCYRLSLSDLGFALGKLLLSRMQPADGDDAAAQPAGLLWRMERVEGESDAILPLEGKPSRS